MLLFLKKPYYLYAIFYLIKSISYFPLTHWNVKKNLSAFNVVYLRI